MIPIAQSRIISYVNMGMNIINLQAGVNFGIYNITLEKIELNKNCDELSKSQWELDFELTKFTQDAVDRIDMDYLL